MSRPQEEETLKAEREPLTRDAREYLVHLGANGIRLGLHREGHARASCTPWIDGAGHSAVATGFASTCWPGRLEEIDGVLLDVAHNADGARALSDALLELYPERQVELVFGVMADKDYREILRALSRGVRRIHLCSALTPRSLAPAECGSTAAELGLLVSTHSTCADALRAARRAAGARGVVCATGSFSVVTEVRRLLLGDRVLSDGEVPWT